MFIVQSANPIPVRWDMPKKCEVGWPDIPRVSYEIDSISHSQLLTVENNGGGRPKKGRQILLSDGTVMTVPKRGKISRKNDAIAQTMAVLAIPANQKIALSKVELENIRDLCNFTEQEMKDLKLSKQPMSAHSLYTILCFLCRHFTNDLTVEEKNSLIAADMCFGSTSPEIILIPIACFNQDVALSDETGHWVLGIFDVSKHTVYYYDSNHVLLAERSDNTWNPDLLIRKAISTFYKIPHSQSITKTYNNELAFGSIVLDKAKPPLTGFRAPVQVNGCSAYLLSGLLPPKDKNGNPVVERFGQLYYVEPDDVMQKRLDGQSNLQGTSWINVELLDELHRMIKACNPFAKLYYDAYETYQIRLKEYRENYKEDEKDILGGEPAPHPHRTDYPDVPAVGMIYENPDGNPPDIKGVMTESRDGETKMLHYSNPQVDPICFPLICPFGQQGYRCGIKLDGTVNTTERVFNLRWYDMETIECYAQLIVHEYSNCNYISMHVVNVLLSLHGDSMDKWPADVLDDWNPAQFSKIFMIANIPHEGDDFLEPKLGQNHWKILCKMSGKHNLNMHPSEWKMNIDYTAQQQINGSDCGPFSLMQAVHFVSNAVIPFQCSNIAAARIAMAKHLISQKIRNGVKENIEKKNEAVKVPEPQRFTAKKTVQPVQIPLRSHVTSKPAQAPQIAQIPVRPHVSEKEPVQPLNIPVRPNVTSAKPVEPPQPEKIPALPIVSEKESAQSTQSAFSNNNDDDVVEDSEQELSEYADSEENNSLDDSFIFPDETTIIRDHCLLDDHMINVLVSCEYEGMGASELWSLGCSSAWRCKDNVVVVAPNYTDVLFDHDTIEATSTHPRVPFRTTGLTEYMDLPDDQITANIKAYKNYNEGENWRYAVIFVRPFLGHWTVAIAEKDSNHILYYESIPERRQYPLSKMVEARIKKAVRDLSSDALQNFDILQERQRLIRHLRELQRSDNGEYLVRPIDGPVKETNLEHVPTENLNDYTDIEPKNLSQETASNLSEDDNCIDEDVMLPRAKPRIYVSQRRYMRYMLMRRQKGGYHHIHGKGKLTQAYILHSATRIERHEVDEAKKAIRENRVIYRGDLHRAISNRLKKHHPEAKLGRIMMDSVNVKGSRKYMQKAYADAMTIINKKGNPFRLLIPKADNPMLGTPQSLMDIFLQKFLTFLILLKKNSLNLQRSNKRMLKNKFVFTV
uniref:Ubiquitin-like protease family profile domain-containing protein n=1 Tax=Ditylenchus dipsaci TaxID=166011 RepID=A0A915DZQ7_9BILA